MSLPALSNTRPQTRRNTTPRPRLQVELASCATDIEQVQRLRYRVFVEEMGAQTHSGRAGIESDRFDPWCDHLLVRDTVSDQVVGCYRILPSDRINAAGGFYSQAEFELGRILVLPGRIMEVGRSCVHPEYRNGATINLLWAGLARYLVTNDFDYLMGCASIPLSLGLERVASIARYLTDHHAAPAAWRVTPRLALPDPHPHQPGLSDGMPALIRAYLRVGAKICGAAAWDPEFNVADVFILLRGADINPRYLRHYVERT